MSSGISNGELLHRRARFPRAQVAWWRQVLDDFEPDDDSSDDEAGLRGPAGRWLNEFCVLTLPADEAGVTR